MIKFCIGKSNLCKVDAASQGYGCCFDDAAVDATALHLFYCCCSVCESMLRSLYLIGIKTERHLTPHD